MEPEPMENNKKPTQHIKELEDEYFRPVIFYNTTLRNVGLFASISLTVMAVAVATNNKNIKAMLRILALLLLSVCAIIIYGLHKTFEDMKSNEEVQNYMKHWNYITYGVACIVAFMIIYDLYKLHQEQRDIFISIKRNFL